MLLPALVNAHLHLELSHLAGAVAGGDGLPAWIERFVKVRATADAARAAPAMARGAAQLTEAGVAAVGDVSNTLDSLEPLAAAGLAGTVFHEVFGAAPDRLAAARQAARVRRAATATPPGWRVVESPHAVYSTDPAGLLELLAGPPASLHLAEDPAEREFVARGGGPFGVLRARMGGAPGQPGWARSPVALAAPRLRSGWLAVHVVDLDDADLRELAACGATAVLCPRSNAHISRAAPPLPRLLAAGVPLAIGTDSLASSPSLAPLAELAALAATFPDLPASALLPLAWNGAAVGAPRGGPAPARHRPRGCWPRRSTAPGPTTPSASWSAAPSRSAAASSGWPATARRSTPREPRRPGPHGAAARTRSSRSPSRRRRWCWWRARRGSTPSACCWWRSAWWRPAPPPWP